MYKASILNHYVITRLIFNRAGANCFNRISLPYLLHINHCSDLFLLCEVEGHMSLQTLRLYVIYMFILFTGGKCQTFKGKIYVYSLKT